MIIILFGVNLLASTQCFQGIKYLVSVNMGLSIGGWGLTLDALKLANSWKGVHPLLGQSGMVESQSLRGDNSQLSC